MSQDASKFKPLGVVKVGGIPHPNLIEMAKGSKVEFTDWGQEILAKTNPLKDPLLVEMVAVLLRIDLPKNSREKTLRPFYEEAFEAGLCLCLPSFGLHLLTQKPHGHVGQARLAMLPVPCRSDQLGRDQNNVLDITDHNGRYSKARWLNGTPADLDEFADAGATYLFCRRHKVLELAGCMKLPPKPTPSE